MSDDESRYPENKRTTFRGACPVAPDGRHIESGEFHASVLEEALHDGLAASHFLYEVSA